MTYNKFNHKNNAICLLDLPIADDAAILIAKGAFNRFPTSNFVIQVTEVDADGKVTARENMLISTRSGSTFNIATRSYEPVPIDDDATSSIQQPLPFSGNAIIENVFSTAVIEDIQNIIDTKADDADLVALDTRIDALENVYAAASGGTDTYTFTIPGVTSYSSVVWKHFTFLADIGNTGPSAVNINWLGVIPIYKNHDQNTETGDIETSQLVEIVIGVWGTYVEMVSQVAKIVDLSSYASRTKNYTISGGVVPGDVVYPSAADTARKLYPTDIQTLGTSLATWPTSNNPCKIFELWGGRVLQVTGWDGSSSGALQAQIRTINAWETDFTFGSNQSIFGSAILWFDVCQIDENTWLAIYVVSATGAVSCKAFTVSGTTITVWSEQAIETSGNNFKVSVAKADTLKPIIFYRKPSDSKTYMQVLTVSGTTITTNTPAIFDDTVNSNRTAAVPITTNKILVCFSKSSETQVKAKTVDISGTTPTANTTFTPVTGLTSSPNGTELKKITSTKYAFCYDWSGWNDLSIRLLWLSGDTVSALWTATTITGCALWDAYRAIQIVWESHLIFSSYRTTPTDMYVRFYSIWATDLTLISTQTSAAVSSASSPSVSICKVSPWTYLITGVSANSDFLLKLTPVSSARLWVAESIIADGVIGSIAKRFNNATLSGLTVWSKYYADDNGNITVNSSLTAPEIGYADSTTNLILT